jgi:hypothetical protein
MRKIHLAIATRQLDETVADYSERLGCAPCIVISGEYALWRTEILNLSVRLDPGCEPGILRHLGWEDGDATEFSRSTDVNGIVWENFSASHQADEIVAAWPQVIYEPD